ncbi:MAG TPA: sugar transferase [bacterium]
MATLNDPALHSRAEPGGWYPPVKRLIDVVAAAAALLVLSPLWLLIAAAIAADSAGPIIFRQHRIGRWSRPFMCWKFRTMRSGTPDLPSHAVSDEQRRRYTTRVGRVLRRLTLDEIPQFVNVLRGEMSLVGPRPALYNQDDLIRMRRERGIDRVRPGMTGLAQVEGRDAITLEEKVGYDERYVRQLSPLADLRCVVKTVGLVLHGQGAN